MPRIQNNFFCQHEEIPVFLKKLCTEIMLLKYGAAKGRLNVREKNASGNCAILMNIRIAISGGLSNEKMKAILSLSLLIFFISCASNRSIHQVSFEEYNEEIAFSEEYISATILEKKANKPVIAFNIFVAPFMASGLAIKEIVKVAIGFPTFGIFSGVLEATRHNFDGYNLFIGAIDLNKKISKKMEKYYEGENVFKKVIPSTCEAKINGKYHKQTYFFNGKNKEEKSTVKDIYVKTSIKDSVERIKFSIEAFNLKAYNSVMVVLAFPFYFISKFAVEILCIPINTFYRIKSKEFRENEKKYKKEMKEKMSKNSLYNRRKKYYKHKR